jgi:hypothetical protein
MKIIELSDSARPMYYSQKIGRDYGSPTGGWTEERDKATAMEEADAEALLAGPHAMVAPFCKVVDA